MDLSPRPKALTGPDLDATGDTPIPVGPSDLETSAELRKALVALNNEHAIELSWVDEARMLRLITNAFLAERVGLADALLIAFDQDADYDGENFLWFRTRYRRFVYVDRVVTAKAARGRGLAATLYRRMIERSRAAGHQRIVCEVNAEPPNPGSEAFHRRMGFAPVGSTVLSNGKTVTYMELLI